MTQKTMSVVWYVMATLCGTSQVCLTLSSGRVTACADKMHNRLLLKKWPLYKYSTIMIVTQCANGICLLARIQPDTLLNFPVFRRGGFSLGAPPSPPMGSLLLVLDSRGGKGRIFYWQQWKENARYKIIFLLSKEFAVVPIILPQNKKLY